MSPEPIMAQAEPVAEGLTPEWKSALTRLALGWAALIAIAYREWGEMLHQWWNIDTYSHILLVPALIGWLVWMRREEIMKAEPKPFWPGLILLALALGLWLVGKISGINLFAHTGAVAALQAAVVTVLGLRPVMMLLLPLGFMAALVPFGDELIPTLQGVTAEITIFLTRLSGIPASINGIYIDTPVGLFIVAEACSGVKFLIAMVTLGVLVCFTAFDSWRKRAAFMLACVIVPILANGVRAWGTIFIAQSQGIEFAEGFDHIVYGWVFFAIVIAILIGGAWRYFEREPEDAGYTFAELAEFGWLAAQEKRSMAPFVCMAIIFGMSAAAALAAGLVSG